MQISAKTSIQEISKRGMSISELLAFFILLLILFDSFQENYFLITFGPDWKQTTFGRLFLSNLMKWGIWGLVAVPFGMVIRKWELRDATRITLNDLGRIFLLILLAIAVSIGLTGIIGASLSDNPFDIHMLSEFLKYYLYQKGLTFFIANSALVWLIQSESRRKVISFQSAWISSLEKKSEELEEELVEIKTQSSQPKITITTGNISKSIPVNDITWIQSDDYCVKIHAVSGEAFTLRRSLKSLEKWLSTYDFVRVHRSVLVNFSYVESIDLSNSRINIHQNGQLPVSQSGAKVLRSKLRNDS